MSSTQPAIMDYHIASPSIRVAAFLLRGWAFVNWLSALLIVVGVGVLVTWQSRPAFGRHDGTAGLTVCTLAGIFAVMSVAWGALCWSLGREVAASDLRAARIARTLTLLLSVGCLLSMVALCIVRRSYGSFYWQGAEGWTWRILFSGTATFIGGTFFTFLMLRRVVASELHRTSRTPTVA